MKEKKEILYKNNKIIKAKYDLTTVQSRVYQYILYKMQQNTINNSIGIYEAYINIEEFKGIIKNRNEQSIESIKSILTILRKGTIYIEEQDTSGYKKWHDYSFISGHDFNEKDGVFRIEASATIYNLLKNYMAGGYTPINLVIFLSLGNSNAQRLYELLRLWSRTNVEKEITYTIDELRTYLLLENKYSRYPDFNRRILKPAVKELNEKAKLKIITEEIKSGRKVIAIKFKVTDSDIRVKEKSSKQTVLPIEEDNKLNDYYIPEELRLDRSCYSRFKNAYKNYDFHSPFLREFLFDAESRTLKKDNVEMITYKNFKYFQKILNVKIEKHEKDFLSYTSDNDNNDEIIGASGLTEEDFIFNNDL